MPLDSIARQYLDQIARVNPPAVETLSPEEARAQMTPPARPLPEVAHIEQRRIGGPGGDIPLRIYTPATRTLDPGDGRPLLLFFHGGGWVVGDLETHDGLCRHLANASGAVTVAVDYRRAPEHKYPAAAEDAYAATLWAARNASELGAENRLVVAGDSAGGNLAAVAALMARDRGGPPLAQQVLLYPVTDCAFDTPSYLEYAEGFFLTRSAMKWFWEQYVSTPQQALEPYASPLRCADLSGLPPAVVLTAECDVLRDEGEAYAARLQQAGVPVELRRFPGMIHGFVRRTDVFPQALEAIAFLGQRIGRRPNGSETTSSSS